MDTKVKAPTLVLVLCAFAGACSPQVKVDKQAERDAKRQAEQEVWVKKQQDQDCGVGPQDPKAINAVRKVFRGEQDLSDGKPDLYGRHADQIANLKTRPNPKGEGVIVTNWTEIHGSGWWARERAAWLVLDGRVYAINQKAANDVGFVWSGIPNSIQRRSGLVDTYERGKTNLDQLGIEEYVSPRYVVLTT